MSAKTINTFTAELGCDGQCWHVIHRKWRPKRPNGSRSAPIERIHKTFRGPNAKMDAFALAAKLLAKSGGGHAKGKVGLRRDRSLA